VSVSLLRQRLEELRSQIDTKRSRATTILSLPADQITPELNTEATQIRQELVAMHTRRGDLEGQIADEETVEARTASANAARVASGTTEVPEARGVGGATVTREERTYTAEKNRRGQASFFADAYRSQISGDANAHQRLARHARELEVEGEGVEQRATTTTSYAGLVVPQYLVDMFAPVLRNGRPLANRVNRLPLPAQGMTLDVPRGTTGAAAASQATQNSALQSTDQVWADLVIPVVTVGGQQDVSRQSLERGTPGMDTIIGLDLARAYNAEIDRQVATGSGASGQMLGVLNTSGIYQATAYTAAVTPATFYSKTAGAVAAIAGAGTEVTPDCWFMAPRRWYWLTSQLDSQGRPLAVPNPNGAMNAMAVNTNPGGYSADHDSDPAVPVGWYHGLPVFLDANLPLSVGTGPEDQALCMDSTKAYLWEDNGGTPRQLKFEQTLGQNLTIKLVLFNYAAFTAARYPVAFGAVGGNAGTAGFGQIAPTF
jgi:HK97 family phage major capsid protein